MPGRAAPSAEDAVKAALIYKFIPFVEWPISEMRSTIKIGVIGGDPLSGALEALEGKSVGSRSLVVKHFGSDLSVGQITQCQIVYIEEPDEKKVRRILGKLAGHAVLTIGDTKRFAENGGMIGFVKKGRRVAFEINSSSLKKSNLSIRSTLMRLAHRVYKGEGGK